MSQYALKYDEIKTFRIKTMLNLGKTIPLFLTMLILVSCGYQSPNSDEFPHKGIQELNPHIKNLQLTHLDTSYIRELHSISEDTLLIDCSKQALTLCLYDFNTHKFTNIHFDQKLSNYYIEQLTQLNSNEYLMVLKYSSPETSLSSQKYIILNKDTLTTHTLSLFDYDAEATKILDQFVQSGFYKKKRQGFTEHYFNEQHLLDQQSENKQKEEVLTNPPELMSVEFITELIKVLYELVKMIILLEPLYQPTEDNTSSTLKVDLVPTGDIIEPAEKFNDKMFIFLNEYIKNQKIACYFNSSNNKNLIFKTKSNYIYAQDFSELFLKNKNFFQLNSCAGVDKVFLPIDEFYKYRSIDDNRSTGNHYAFGFYPVGYDIFEIKQNNQTKQFKLPIQQYQMYQIKNDLIFIYNQTYFIIPTSP